MLSVFGSINAGRYADAEMHANAVLSGIDVVHDLGSPEAMRAGDVLVRALVLNGKAGAPATLIRAQQIVERKHTLLGSNNPELAPSLTNLANVLAYTGQYERANAHYNEALRLLEALPIATNIETAQILDEWGHTMSQAGRFDEAEKLLRRALGLKERGLGPNAVGVARTLGYLAAINHERGEYAAAAPLVDRVLTIHARRLPLDHPERAVGLDLLGEQRWFEGKLKDSADAYARAVTIAQQALQPHHPLIALYLRHEANAESTLGNTRKGRALLERALRIREQQDGTDDAEGAWLLNDLGDTLMLYEGDYAGARMYFDRALSTIERQLGHDHVNAATVIHNLAILSAHVGDYLEAHRLQERAIAIWSHRLGAEHPFVALALDALAEVLTEQGRPDEALPLYTRALAIRERTLGLDHVDVAWTLTNLARAMEQMGRFSDAQRLTDRALQIWRRAETPDNPHYSETLMLTARLQANQGLWPQARQNFEQAWQARQRLFGPTHPEVAEARAGLAAVLFDSGEIAAAYRQALEVEVIGREHLRLTVPYLAERSALGYAARRPAGLDLALSILVATGTTHGAQVSDAFGALMQSRGIVLDEMAARQGLDFDQASPNLRSLRLALVSARQRFANLVVRGPTDLPTDQFIQIIDEARREEEQAEQALAEQSTEFRSQLARSRVDLPAVRSALPDGTALVSFVRFELRSRTVAGDGRRGADSPYRLPPITPAYLAFVLTSRHAEPIVVSLGQAASIEALVTRWRAEMEAGWNGPSHASDVSTAGPDAGEALRRAIWDPLTIDSHSVRRVFIVPDGALNLVSLAALPAGTSRYLVEQGPTIHYLSTERDLLRVQTHGQKGRGLLALGGPSFDQRPEPREHSISGALDGRGSGGVEGPHDPIGAVIVAGVETPRPAGRSSTVTCGSFQSLRFRPLPAALREVQELGRLWTSVDVSNQEVSTAAAIRGGLARRASDPPIREAAQVLTGPLASEAAFKLQAPTHRVLHLATHGFFLGGACTSAFPNTRAVGGLSIGTPVLAGENPLLLSGLAFAGANQRATARPDDDDGILTAEEVSALDLEGVEWAVLSACDTGVGEVRAGEGVFGLRRAFQIAGAQTVIMSLWSVEDRSAGRWMRALYEARLRQGLDTADAVRKASLTVLRERRARGEGVHPFFWGGFVAAGDWR